MASVVRGMMSRLDQTKSFEHFFREGARSVRALTGFDRVMVYRFDEEGSGEVVAEAARSGIGSFLGLRYPASDIPAQARTLYLRNLFRVIADVSVAPVPVIPVLDEGGAPLDLSLAITRAVSPIHIEYLRNMGVKASMSISIVIDGRLWGLFACHHYEPLLPSLQNRSLAELIGQMFAMKLESRQRQDRSEQFAKARQITDTLLGALGTNAALLTDPMWLGETLNQAIESDGVGVVINGRVALSGLAPNEREFQQIVRVLNGMASNRIYATDELNKLLRLTDTPEGAVSGLLAMPISRSPRDYLVLFRQERVRSVRWAGDPHKPVEYGPNGPRLSPRKSFESWAELVRGRSAPFTQTELRVAEILRTSLIEVVLRLSEEAHVERRQANERQDLLIAELNHRVRNILSLIRSMVRQTEAGSKSVDSFVDELDSRINALARAHNQITNDRWGPAPLRLLIETEAEAYFNTRSTRVTTEGVEVLLAPQAFSAVALVIHELITNSAKYGGLSDSGHVDVTWQLDAEGDLLLQWREVGGPAVQAPTRQGFGSTIIQRSIPFELGGKAEVHYLLTGLEAHFTIPARHVSLPPTPVGDAPRRKAQEVRQVSGRTLAGCRVLLVEDSLMIAMEAEDNLVQLGAASVQTASTVEHALLEIDRNLPQLALLDVNLGSETSIPIALKLQEVGVPFFFATGYGERLKLPEALDGVPVIQKPYNLQNIAVLIDGIKTQIRTPTRAS